MKKLKVNKQKLVSITFGAFVWTLGAILALTFIGGLVSFLDLSFELAICGSTFIFPTLTLVGAALRVATVLLVVLLLEWVVYGVLIKSMEKEN